MRSPPVILSSISHAAPLGAAALHSSTGAVAAPAVPTRSPHSPRTAPGVRVGSWRLVERIAEGTLARLYRARPGDAPAEWPSDYCVKLLKPELAHDPLAVDMLRREAQVGRAVAHPQLISILAAEIQRGAAFVVMPFLEGHSVEQLLSWAAGQRLPSQMALWIARQTAEALGALHAAGWVHADVKPGNIVVSPAGHATLIDLGLAHAIARPGRSVDRALCGTLHYTAPERLTSSLRGGPASDVYSLGVTLFEMLAGVKPFDAPNRAAIATAHLERAVPDLRAHLPQLSGRIARLLKRMLAKDPLRRPTLEEELIPTLVDLEIEAFGEGG